MQPPLAFRVARLLAGTITAVHVMNCAQASNISYQLTGTAGNWSANSWSPATIGSIGAGDFAYYGETAGTSAITLDAPVTLGALSIGTLGTKAWTINASGGNVFTLDGTGINGTNNFIGSAGVAAIGSRGVGANLTIIPDIVFTSTDLDMGNTNTGTLTIGGNITASTEQALNFRGSGSGVVTVNGSIGASGSNIAISNQRGSGGHVTIAGSLGSSVTSVTENSSNSNLILFAANTSYAGTMMLTAGILQGLNSEATNVLQAFGPGGITLNGGTLQLRANGTGSTQTIITGNGTVGNDVTVGGNTTINVQRNNGSNTGNTLQFNNLNIGGNMLSVTNTNTYGLRFAGTTTLTGHATLNLTAANVTLGTINDGGGAYSITKTGTGTLTLTATSTATGGTNVSSGGIQYNSAAAIGGTGRNVLVGPNGLVIVGYAIDQAFLDRLDSASTGMVVIGVGGTTSTDLDFTNNAAYLGTNAAVTYTGLLTPQGTTYRLGGGGGTLTLSNANAITGAGNSLVVGSPVQSGTGIVALTNSNDIGTVTVNANTLLLSGANGALPGVSTVNLNAGSLVIDNTGAGNNNNSRIKDSAAFNFGGGALTYKGYNTAGTNSTETIGNLTLLAGPQSTFTVTYGSTNMAVVSAGTLIRSAGLGTMLVNGNGLGKNDSATASVARLLLGSAPTLIGTGDAADAGNGAVKNVKIVPFLVGEAAATATTGVGTVTGTANTFVTWNANTGLRPLNPIDEFTNDAIATDDNIRIAGADVTASTGDTVNSLVIARTSPTALTITDGYTLTDTSGALLFANTATIKPSTSTGILNFGSTEAIVTVNSGLTGSISAPITCSGGFTKAGPGQLNLDVANPLISGGLTVDAGKLVFNNGSNQTGTGVLTIAEGATLDNRGNNWTVLNNSQYMLNGNFAFPGSGNSNSYIQFTTTNGGNVVMGNNITVTQTSGQFTWDGVVSDGGSGYGLTKGGTGGQLTLTNTANTYSGKTVVLGGTLIANSIKNVGGAASGLGQPTTVENGTIDVYTGATLKLNGINTTDRVINLAGGPGTVTLLQSGNGGSLTLNSALTTSGHGAKTLSIFNGGDNTGDSVTTIFNAAIPNVSDGSPLSIQITYGSQSGGPGTVTLNGANTFTGPISMIQGQNPPVSTLTIGGAGQLNGGSYANTISMATSMTFKYASSAEQTLSGAISGAGGLTEAGPGTLTLSGTNSYGGSTTVSGGKLLVNGTNSGAGAVNVSANATLGGTGTIGGNTTIAATGRLAFTLSTVAASHDKLDITGTLVFSGASVLDITASGGAPAAGLYTLVTATGGITGSVPATLNLPTDWLATVSKSLDNKSLLLDVTSTGAPNPYGIWAEAKGLDGSTGKENGPNDDPDKDGRSNFAEFAFDGNPLSGANDGKVVGKVATLLSDSSSVLTLTLPVRRDAIFSGTTAQVSALIDGLVYTIQGSDTLEAAAWTLAVTEITGTDAAAIQAGLPGLSDINNDTITDWTYRTFRSPGTVTDGDPRDFLRANVTQQ